MSFWFVFCSWIRREVLLDKVKRGAVVLLNDFVAILGGLIVPSDVNLEDFFTETKTRARKIYVSH